MKLTRIAVVMLAVGLLAGATGIQASGTHQGSSSHPHVGARSALPDLSVPWARAVGVSTATNHVFAVSLIPSTGKSWITMLNGKTGKTLRVTALPDFSKMVAVDDHTQHPFVTSASAPNSGGRLSVTVLDTRTGTIVGTVDCGASQGLWQESVKARQTARLIVVAPDALHLIDLKTGGHVGAVPMSASAAQVAIHDSTGRILVVDTSGAVSVYDAHTGALVRATNIPAPVSMYTNYVPVVQTYGSVPVITGTNQDTLTMLNARTGDVAWSLQIPARRGNITTFPFDESIGRIYAVSMGNFWDPNSPPPGETVYSHVGNGVVSTINLKTHKIIRAVEVGQSIFFAAVDPKTHHLFVLSLAGFTPAGAPIERSSIAMIDGKTGKLLRAIRVPYMNYSYNYSGIVVDSANSRAYVTLNMNGADANTLTVINTKTGKVLPAIGLPSEPGT